MCPSENGAYLHAKVVLEAKVERLETRVELEAERVRDLAEHVHDLERRIIAAEEAAA
jgi:hypothetical protein